MLYGLFQPHFLRVRGVKAVLPAEKTNCKNQDNLTKYHDFHPECGFITYITKGRLIEHNLSLRLELNEGQKQRMEENFKIKSFT